ncbi:MAG: DUF4845 domain-containing protein [Burkholderiales bacterium]|nr:DUF4845 domain-containing protein [Burkholderiales bacterium]
MTMTASSSRHAPRRRQRGLTLFGLLFWAILIGFVGYVAVVALPTMNEYWTIQRTVDKIAASNPGTVGEARTAFDRQKDIEYSIQSVSGKDLEVTKEDGQVVIGFAYDKEIPLVGPVYLLIKYEGRTR